MLVERAELRIRAGAEAAFEAGMRAGGIACLAAVPGVLSVRLGQGVESPGTFLLLVEWHDMAAHAAFNRSAASGTLRGYITPYAEHGSMEHFLMS